MLDHERFIDKAEAETGQPVLAYAQGRCLKGDDTLGVTGLLCAIGRGLAFVEEEVLDPGEVWTLDRSAIVSVRLRSEVLDASLRVRTEDEEILFEHLEAEAAAELLVRAELRNREPEPAPEVTVVAEEEEEALPGAAPDEEDDESFSEPPPSRGAPPPAPRHRRRSRSTPPPAPRHKPEPELVEHVPTPSKNKWAGILIALGIAVAGALVSFVVRSPDQASLTVAVRSGGEELDAVAVYVDGQQRCDASPCVLELDPGKRHVRAVRGAATADRFVDLAPGSTERVALELPAEADDGTSRAPKATTANLELYGSSEDIEVFVNGERKGTLPVVLLDLPPGEIELSFQGGADYRTLERTVTLEAGKTLVIDDIRLPVRMVEVEFVVAEAVTSVELVRRGHPERVTAIEPAADGRATRKLDTSHRWAVRAKGEGGLQLWLPIDFADGEPTKTIEVAFPIEPEVGADEGAAGPGAGGAGATSAQQGKLMVTSVPPAQVIVDGRPVGTTPVTGLEVAPGHHVVILVNEQGRKSRSVNVEAGKTTVVTVRF